MLEHYAPNKLVVFEGIDGTGKTTTAKGVVEEINLRAEIKESPALSAQTIEDIAQKLGSTRAELQNFLYGRRVGGAVQIDNFPFHNPVEAAIDKKKFEDQYGVDMGAYLYILSALFKNRAILTLLPHLNVVCDRYFFSLIAKHRALGEKSQTFNYEQLEFTKPNLFYLLKTDETQRQARIRVRGNPTYIDKMAKVPGSRPWKIEEEMEKFKPEILDTTNLTKQAIIDRVMIDFDRLSK